MVAQDVRIISYNVENLFDYQHDSLKNDSSFLPDGMHHWSYYRYQTKLDRIAQVIVNISGWVFKKFGCEFIGCERAVARHTGVAGNAVQIARGEQPLRHWRKGDETQPFGCTIGRNTLILHGSVEQVQTPLKDEGRHSTLTQERVGIF